MEDSVENKQVTTGPLHVHDYYGRTSVDHDHFHTFVGSTETQVQVGEGHVHRYASETRVAMNHTHILSGNSTLPIPARMGHFHQLQGTTTVNDGHSHTYDLYTGYQRAPRNRRRRRPMSAMEAPSDEKGAPQQRRPFMRPPFFRNPSEKEQ